MKLTLRMLMFSVLAVVAPATTVGNSFETHFSINLPEAYTLTFAGGKPGEKQFSIYDGQHKFMVSIFVYDDGLDPREWKGTHDKERDEFLLVSGDVLVWAKLPKDLSPKTREALWNILLSIERKLQPDEAIRATPT